MKASTAPWSSILLLERFEFDAEQNNLKPLLVVISGDIAWQGIDEECSQAKEFFIHFLTVLHLENDSLLYPGKP